MQSQTPARAPKTFYVKCDKKKAFYLSVKVNFRMKVLIGDTIFTFPTKDKKCLFMWPDDPSHGKV